MHSAISAFPSMGLELADSLFGLTLLVWVSSVLDSVNPMSAPGRFEYVYSTISMVFAGITLPVMCVILAHVMARSYGVRIATIVRSFVHVSSIQETFEIKSSMEQIHQFVKLAGRLHMRARNVKLLHNTITCLGALLTTVIMLFAHDVAALPSRIAYSLCGGMVWFAFVTGGYACEAYVGAHAEQAMAQFGAAASFVVGTVTKQLFDYIALIRRRNTDGAAVLEAGNNLEDRVFDILEVLARAARLGVNITEGVSMNIDTFIKTISDAQFMTRRIRRCIKLLHIAYGDDEGDSIKRPIKNMVMSSINTANAAIKSKWVKSGERVRTLTSSVSNQARAGLGYTAVQASTMSRRIGGGISALAGLGALTYVIRCIFATTKPKPSIKMLPLTGVKKDRVIAKIERELEARVIKKDPKWKLYDGEDGEGYLFFIDDRTLYEFEWDDARQCASVYELIEEHEGPDWEPDWRMQDIRSMRDAIHRGLEAKRKPAVNLKVVDTTLAPVVAVPSVAPTTDASAASTAAASKPKKAKKLAQPQPEAGATVRDVYNSVAHVLSLPQLGGGDPDREYEWVDFKEPGYEPTRIYIDARIGKVLKTRAMLFEEGRIPRLPLLEDKWFYLTEERDPRKRMFLRDLKKPAHAPQQLASTAPNLQPVKELQATRDAVPDWRGEGCIRVKYKGTQVNGLVIGNCAVFPEHVFGTSGELSADDIKVSDIEMWTEGRRPGETYELKAVPGRKVCLAIPEVARVMLTDDSLKTAGKFTLDLPPKWYTKECDLAGATVMLGGPTGARADAALYIHNPGKRTITTATRECEIEVIEHNINTTNGDCGSPVLLRTMSGLYCIGWHTFGVRGRKNEGMVLNIKGIRAMQAPPALAKN